VNEYVPLLSVFVLAVFAGEDESLITTKPLSAPPEAAVPVIATVGVIGAGVEPPPPPQPATPRHKAIDAVIA
jgi:hypothetical protein